VITTSAEAIRDANSAGANTIGYTRAPEEHERLTAAGANATIGSLADQHSDCEHDHYRPPHPITLCESFAPCALVAGIHGQGPPKSTMLSGRPVGFRVDDAGRSFTHSKEDPLSA
jgi:hypothetical protein